MIRSLWSAASGMLAQQLNVDTISNNLANVNTPGFKRSRVQFEELFYQNLRPPGAVTVLGQQLPLGLAVGQGVRPVATERIFSAGNLQRTDLPTDLAIQGDGFFTVDMGQNKIGYTRDGSFHLDGQGRLVTSSGYLLRGESGPITILPGSTDISLAADGTVTVLEPGANQPQEVGKLILASFANPAGLESLGQNLLGATPAAGDPAEWAPGDGGRGTVMQGMLEMSNVSVVEEMVNLIVAQRAYEINTKAVQSSDEMLQQANNLRR